MRLHISILALILIVITGSTVFGVTLSSSTFTSDADGWNIAVWKLNPEYSYGSMVWSSSAGSSGGGMRASGAGASDSDDTCTREGGEISKVISTSGYQNITVSYDLRVNSLGNNYTGSGIGPCSDDHGLIDEQLTVFYSIDGGTTWTEAEWIKRSLLLSSYRTYGTRTFSLSSATCCNNNPYFALRFRWQVNNGTDLCDLDNITVTGVPYQGSGDTNAPGPVTSFRVDAGAGQNTLTWTNPVDSDFKGIMIRYKTTGYPASPTDGTLLLNKVGTPGATASFIHTGLTAGVTYYYSAFTYDCSLNYSSATNTTIPTPTAPVIISPLSGAIITTATPLIQWTGSAHDMYEVHINTTNQSGDANGWDSGQVLITNDFCTSGSLTNRIYYVFVRLRNTSGWGPWSAQGRIFTVNASQSPPEAPVVVIPTDGATTWDNTPAIQWISGPHDGYEVHITGTDSPTSSIRWDSGEAFGAFDTRDTAPLPQGEYYVYVRVHNSFGWGPWSAAGRNFIVNPSAPRMKKGWVLIRDDDNTDDVQYHEKLLRKAGEYHVNQVQLSHSIMMYTWQPINDIARRNRINNLIQLAKDNGVEEVVLWVHDIQDNQYRPVPSYYKTVDGKIDLDNEGFWNWLAHDYEVLFDVCPNADGLVLTLTENFVYGGADVYDRTMTKHTGKTPEDSCLKLIQTVWNVCKSRGKSLYVRNWTLWGGADRWIRNAVIRTGDPNIWMMSKATGAGDWDVIQEDYDIIGTCTGHPEMVEFDVIGEFWGYTWTPWCGINYLKHLWSEFSVPRGADGVVARIEREDMGEAPGIHPRSIDGPNRINMYALDVLAEYPDLAVDDIYTFWSSHWFGPTAAQHVASALKRTFDISNGCYKLPKPNGSPNYAFSTEVAKDDCLKSLYDIDCVSAELRSSDSFEPGGGRTNYQVLRDPLVRAAGKLGLTVPSILFGDFTSSYDAQGRATCRVTTVDANIGLNPGLFSISYSTDSGSTWAIFSSAVEVSGGTGYTSPYTITANSIPFGSPTAGRNRIRFSAVNTAGESASKEFAVSGSDTASVVLGNSIISDGIYDAANGANTVSFAQDGRSCRRPSSSADPVFYLKVDDAFAYDRLPQTLYLQLDYFGTSGSITPVYDSTERTDETLTPVYLNTADNTWKTVTWRLDNVNFGNRLSSGADLKLIAGLNVYISGVRLYKSPPPGFMVQPTNIQASAVSSSQMNLSWNPISGASRYQITRSGMFAGWTTAATFTDTNLLPNTEYTYTVTAHNQSSVSCSSRFISATTLAAPPSTSTVTCDKPVREWQSSGQFNFKTVNGFGWGKVAYYRYVLDESPTHVWTGSEPTWPSDVSAPSGPDWSSWKATTSPTSGAESGWLLYDGSTTQRLMSESLITENGTSTWKLMDQGRVVNTKSRIALWPTAPIDRNQGFTMMVRMKAADSPLGWSDSSINFGINQVDAPEIGVVIRPDWLQLVLPSPYSISGVSAPENGFSYHTYVLTVKDDTYTLYRDGKNIHGVLCPTRTSASMWSGPFFGHISSNAVGTWYFQWIAWMSKSYTPAEWDSNLTLSLTAPHKGSSYYLHLQAFNADGYPSGTLDLGPYYYGDGSTLVPPTVTDDGTYTTRNAVHFKWTPAAATVTGYKYAVGSSPTIHDDILPYTLTQPEETTNLEATCRNLSLTEGHTYYISVRGVNASGDGPDGTSDGIVTAPVYSIGEAKAHPDGSPIALYDKTVTALFNGYSYIQEPYGPGIKLITNRPVSLGWKIDLAGVISGAGSERTITADTVILTAP